MKQNHKLYLWLLKTNLFISAFTFGGGYVVVPMVRRYFVQQKHLFSEEELSEMAAVAQSTPGAIAINLSAISGYRTAGLTGAVISCISAFIPPLVILSFISMFYSAFIANAAVAAVLKGMQAGVAALIVDVVVDMCRMILRENSVFLTAMVPISFAANFIFGVNVALILIVCCLLCITKVLYRKRKTK